MDDILQVARKARQAAEIFAGEKHAASKDKALKDVYLVGCVLGQMGGGFLWRRCPTREML